MDSTPKAKISRVSCRPPSQNSTANEEIKPCANTSTPTQLIKPLRLEMDDYSPVFMQCTQLDNDVDVIWDWHSPQAKRGCIRKQKKLNLPNSPKVPLKKYPSNSQIPAFDKLKEELEDLRDHLVSEQHIDISEKEDGNKFFRGLDCSIDDHLERQLIQCSQMAEEILTSKEIKNKFVGLETKCNNVICDNVQSMLPRSKFNVKPAAIQNKRTSRTLNSEKSSEIIDDSFDVALEAFKDEDFELLSQAEVKCSPKKSSSCMLTTGGVNNGHFEIQRNETYATTAELNSKVSSNKFVSNYNNNVEKPNSSSNKYLSTGRPDREVTFTSISSDVSQSSRILQDIEQKRIQALAKLEAKKKQQQHQSDVSPIKCSPEEIEKKRMHALTKLQAKKKQEVIEKNRLEAQKRLQMNRQKRGRNF